MVCMVLLLAAVGQGNDRTKGITRQNDGASTRLTAGGQARHEIQCCTDIVLLAGSSGEITLAAAHPPKVKSQSGQTRALTGPDHGFHDIVVHVSPEERMGMQGHDNTILHRRCISQEALEATGWAGEFYLCFVNHVVVIR
jgi:hypothetical protein